MTMHAGYLVDLSGVKLDEATNTSWIQIMPLGKYDHPQYGKIDITPERVKQFADGVAANVRGQELDIDYDHKEHGGDAAGWIKQAQARSDGLWALVEWTATAAAKIKEKAYKYFSPEFYDEWKHPSTNVVHKDVLFGGGITNRPFLKGILPLNLSEAFTDAAESSSLPKPNEGGKGMTPELIKDLATKLGLKDDATEADVATALGAHDFKAKTPDPVDPAAPTSIAAAEKALADAKKLAEDKPEFKAMIALMETQTEALKVQQKLLHENSVVLKLAEVNETVKKLSDLAHEAGYALPIPVRDEIRSTLVGIDNKKLSEVIVKSYEEIFKGKLVQLNEKGSTRSARPTETGDHPRDKFLAEVVKLSEEKKITQAVAIGLVANENPDLYREYRKSYSNGGEL